MDLPAVKGKALACRENTSARTFIGQLGSNCLEGIWLELRPCIFECAEKDSVLLHHIVNEQLLVQVPVC